MKILCCLKIFASEKEVNSEEKAKETKALLEDKKQTFAEQRAEFIAHGLDV